MSWVRRRTSRLRASRLRRASTGLLLLAVLGGPAVAACGGLPGTGPVQQGLGVDGQDLDPVRMLPDGPFPGDDPSRVVRGFLRAGAGFDDEHVVARSFLSPRFAKAWRPAAEVTVLRDSTLRTTTSGSSVHVKASIVASIDAGGQYRELHVARPLSATFGVQRVAGQWRIASAPTQLGLWLSTSDLQRLYRAYAVYYTAPAARILVPDIRWLPLGSGLATSLARAQLAPVPGYLKGAVVTGVATGTRLALEAVPVQSGLATVDLATPGLSADPRLRQALWAQFVATMTQAPNVSEVSLEVGGSTVELPDMRGYPSLPDDVGYPTGAAPNDGPGAVVRDGSRLQRINGDGVARDGSANAAKGAAPTLPQVPTGWIGLALSGDGGKLAAIGGDHADLSVWRGTQQSLAPRFATRLTRPSFDTRGWVWTCGSPLPKASKASKASKAKDGKSRALPRTGRSATSSVFALDASAKNGSLTPVTVMAPWLAGRVVVALRVATDDQRAVLITRRPDGGDTRVQVTGILRGGDGRPRALTTPLRVGVPLTAATDASWVDDRTVAVLGQASRTAAVRPYLIGLGAATTPLAPVKGARWITSTGDLRGILVATDGGQIFERAGAGWAVQSRGSDVAVAGG